jgi:hypothetical protein
VRAKTANWAACLGLLVAVAMLASPDDSSTFWWMVLGIVLIGTQALAVYAVWAGA